jgi:phage head maturation protease
MEKRSRGDLLKPSRRFLPIANWRQDGSAIMVYGYLTTEAVDSYGTVFSLDATRDALVEYEKWRTLRAMHQPIAAGTVPVLELDDVGLWIGARVVDEAEQRKVTEGVYKGFSIGFDPRDGRYELRGGAEVFVFTAYDLIESSLVDRNSNPETVFTLWTRRDAPFLLAEKTAGWTFDWKNDADAILAKGGQSLLADAVAWYDQSAADDDGDGYPDAKSAYKLPVAKLAAAGDERLTLYYYGVAAAMAALNGARKGVAIPYDEREAVYKRLASYYRLFDETPPEFQRRAQEDTMDERQIEQAVEKAAHGFFSRLFGRKAADGREEAPKVKVKAASLEAAAGLRAELAALGEPAKPAVESLDAALGRLEAEAAEPPAEKPPADPSAENSLETRLQALETQNRALREGLDQALAARKSQETVDGGKPFKSRYNGAFFH